MWTTLNEGLTLHDPGSPLQLHAAGFWPLSPTHTPSEFYARSKIWALAGIPRVSEAQPATCTTMFTSRSLTVCTLAALALHRGANADLRMAAQPKNGYLVKDRSRVPFVSQDGDTKAARLRNDKFAIYMEPSGDTPASASSARP